MALSSTDDSDFYPAFTVVTVGVADLDEALSLWVGEFGFNVARSKEGPDAELARLWGLRPEDIARQALVRTNDHNFGMVHIVEFTEPDAPVREGAKNFDLTPKNLDVYVNNLPQKFAQMKDKGFQFRTEAPSEFTAEDGTTFREIHLPSHDKINIVLLEVVGEQHDYSPADVAGIGPFIFTVPDIEKENAFFEAVFPVEKLSHNVFSGPEIEKIVGLPEGTTLNITIWGRKGHDLGKLEIVEYGGVESANLYPRAKPKALGVLHVGYVVPDNGALMSRLEAVSVPFEKHGVIDSLIATGEVISFSSPAGLRIEVYDE